MGLYGVPGVFRRSTLKAHGEMKLDMLLVGCLVQEGLFMFKRLTVCFHPSMQ